jgi:crossover junction endodeoxyribonuclease RuvC
MVILGIDPGSVRVGFGVIEKIGGRLSYVQSGLLKVVSGSPATRLITLETEFTSLLRKTRPEIVGLERLFFMKNQKTAFSVAEARGILLGVLAKRAIPWVEFTPPQVKLATTGDGRASKSAVAKMVRHFLSLSAYAVVDDVTDALAIAIAASQSKQNGG